ncbi:unnamed protein product [Phaeothamnion confervicola]
MARAATAFRSICSIQMWREELSNISPVIVRTRALLRHIKLALEDAHGAFAHYELTDGEAYIMAAGFDGSACGGIGGGGGGGANRNGSTGCGGVGAKSAAGDGGNVNGGNGTGSDRNGGGDLSGPGANGGGGDVNTFSLRGVDSHAAVTASRVTAAAVAAGLPDDPAVWSTVASSGPASVRGARNFEERMHHRARQAQHLLEIQVHARRLERCINSEGLRFVRRLVATRQDRPLSLEFVVRFNTAVFSVMSLQRGMLPLAHALLEVIERERFAYYYA